MLGLLTAQSIETIRDLLDICYCDIADISHEVGNLAKSVSHHDTST